MNLELRQIEMYNYIKERTEVSVATLAQQFGVSQVTIRRTLKRLEGAGLVNHAYGKANIADTSRTEFTFRERVNINPVGKHKMAEIAQQYIADTSIKSAYFDGSSSALEVIKLLPKNANMTIFTNSFSILLTLRDKPQIRTFFIGGFMDWNDLSTADITTEDQCKQIFVDATFTSCGGFSEAGTFNNGYTGAQIRRIMMKNSLRNYLLADHTKYKNQGVFLLNTWDSIDVLITDQELPLPFLDNMRMLNVDVQYSKSEAEAEARPR